jgi:hypothetical protein
MPRRTPGTTNAPGGKWHSPTNADRKSPAVRFTLSPRAVRALAYLAGKGDRSAEVSAAIVERAERRGWVDSER